MDSYVNRNAMVFVASNVWEESLERTTSLLERLNSHIRVPEAGEKVHDSFETLKSIHEALRDEKYIKIEDHILFKDLAIKLEDVFKHLLQAYAIEHSLVLTDRNGNRIALSEAKVDYLTMCFVKSVSERSTPTTYHRIYPAITLLIRYLRNSEEHETSKPVDHITGKHSYGNVYTLCSLFIVTIYAYKEILEKWIG